MNEAKKKIHDSGVKAREDDSCPFCEAEWEAILEHQKKLSSRAGQEVSIEAAIGDWLEHFSRDWRRERISRALQSEREEILRHKWLESEKAGHDIGNSAVSDWIGKHAARWRKCWEDQAKSNPPAKSV